MSPLGRRLGPQVRRRSRPLPAARRWSAAALATVVGAGLLVAATPSVASAQIAPDAIIVEGRGWGHGNGMSQWGALGYAVDYGWSSAQILDHFYSNTHAGTVDNEDIRVHLRSQSGRPLYVTSASPFHVDGHRFDGNQVARIQAVANDTFHIHRSSGCGSVGTLIAETGGRRGANGDAFVEAIGSATDPSADDLNRMLVVIYCDRQQSALEATRITYRGAVGAVEQGNETEAFVRLPIEEYLRAVVPRESHNSWGGLGDGRGIAALEAQAVAARSYTINLARYRRARGFFTDSCGDASCQVFGGSARNGRPLDSGADYIFSNTAVANTAGLVRLYDETGEVAFTEYSSSSGGWTAPLSEGSRFPAAEDLGDHSELNPNHTWQTTIRRRDVEAAYPELGQLVGIEVTQRNGLGEWGGRTRAMTLYGTKGNVELNFTRWANDTFRRTFSLRSDWYRFPQFVDGFPIPDPDPDDGVTQLGDGMWVAKSDGTVGAFGDASFHGDLSGSDRHEPIVGIAAHPSGHGYWLVASDGGVFSFGAAAFHGSMGGTPLDKPVVGIAAHPSGHGYWLVASDGGVFSFGAAAFHGSMGGTPLDKPVNGMSATASGGGYWMVASDGGIFSFGDAGYFGSAGGGGAGDTEIVEMVTAGDGQGYWLLGADSGLFEYGSAVDRGSRGSLENRRPAAAMTRTQSGNGYWIVWDDGTSFPYGDAVDYITSSLGEGVVAVASVP